jgi:hypothetical protein
MTNQTLGLVNKVHGYVVQTTQTPYDNYGHHLKKKPYGHVDHFLLSCSHLKKK